MEHIVKLTDKQLQTLTPLGRWLLSYASTHEVTLTELARQAGLSDGALRSLVRYPERSPTLETCLRLSGVTGKPPEEIFALAGIQFTPGQYSPNLNPERMQLLRIYDQLPPDLRSSLMEVARAMRSTHRKSTGDSTSTTQKGGG